MAKTTPEKLYDVGESNPWSDYKVTIQDEGGWLFRWFWSVDYTPDIKEQVGFAHAFTRNGAEKAAVSAIHEHIRKNSPTYEVVGGEQLRSRVMARGRSEMAP